MGIVVPLRPGLQDERPFREQLADALTLPVDERRWLITGEEPSPCDLCGGPVYPKDGHWWNSSGVMHNLSCKGYPPRDLFVPRVAH